MNKKYCLTLIFLCLLQLPAAAQLKYEWTPVPMDSTWDAITDRKATDIIARYEPELAPMQEIIGYSVAEYTKSRPESGLSNMLADMLRETGEKAVGCHVDVGMVNFGGIRTSLPKGAVRIYDIYSICPFNNAVVVFDITGEDLTKFFERSAGRNRLASYSGIRMDVVDRKVVLLEVGGEPVDKERVYKFATIDFLLDGGDGIDLTKEAHNIVKTGIYLRDAVIDRIRELTAAGGKIDLSPDGRVTVSNGK